MKKTITKSKLHNNAIEKALSIIKESTFFKYINGVILFGSVARGTFTINSDVDLFIEFSKDIPFSRFEIASFMSEIRESGNFSVEIDPHYYIGDDWKEEKETFYKNIKKDCVYLYRRT